MIGNDIVDLAEARQKSNWERPRFLEKLFTSQEQQLIQNSKNQFLMVWRLWSMKEAAYKLFTQLHPSRFYNPKQFKCEISGLDGTVSYSDFICCVKTKTTSQYVLSEARLGTNEMISEWIETPLNSAKAQSDFMKTRVLSILSKQLNILNEELKILKSDLGIPSVYLNGKKLDIAISISHHGNYGTYAILC